MSVQLLVEEIASLLQGSKPRTMIGIVGKPGAGKSTVVTEIQKQFSTEDVAIIPMDGYHLSNEELIRLGRRERKGAPDTFDVEGFISLITRVRNEIDKDHTFHIFHREIEASKADEGIVLQNTKVIVIEGNYLFSEEHNWSEVFPLLDQSWFIEIDDEIRMQRLITRHIKYGKTPQEAEDWSRGSDEANAKFIAKTASRAERIIKL
ncbi:MAG: nucleoside/nucleotide kinase family protein [Actinobacteria bacterium]|nr:nucleoside/nucleotide kinase family protein [Actinomycetota bacterium]